ncbi:MAG: esterase, partial [Mesorhizobium sp.]
MGTNQLEAARWGKYATLLDPELWDYIDQVNAWFPPAIVAQP